MVYFMIQTDWSNLEKMEVLRNVGTIGGLYFFSDMFRKEASDALVSGDEQ